MVDRLTPAARSVNMRAVRSRDTKPELDVRKLLTRLGHRYRLHRADLPGRPDIAFIGRGKAVFVHGCFWHGHDCRRGARLPLANAEFWRTKIARNRVRDAEAIIELQVRGWRALVIWECELRDVSALTEKLEGFLA